MSIDAIKVSKVETILAGLTRNEQIHVAAFLASVLGTTPVAYVPTPAPAAAPAPSTTPKTFREMERELMTTFRLRDLVQFKSSRTGQMVQARIVKFNQRTLGLDNGYRVSPQLLTLVHPRAPAPAPIPARVPSVHVPSLGSMPTAPGAGTW